MRLSRPQQLTWILALILGVLGILAYLLPLGGLSAFAFWLVAIAWLLLVLGTALRGL
ncbi:MAG TPA: hypothetical protein VLC52_00915 [Anaerolineae bacterium]|nr:hypothetical protein [Anaerolineae bacterium]